MSSSSIQCAVPRRFRGAQQPASANPLQWDEEDGCYRIKPSEEHSHVIILVSSGMWQQNSSASSSTRLSRNIQTSSPSKFWR